MIGSGDPTPYDFPLILLFAIVTLVLIAGAIAGTAWLPVSATWMRRGSVLFAICALASVLAITPTRNGIIGAGRMITIWPAFAIVILAYLVCSWRAGRL